MQHGATTIAARLAQGVHMDVVIVEDTHDMTTKYFNSECTYRTINAHRLLRRTQSEDVQLPPVTWHDHDEDIQENIQAGNQKNTRLKSLKPRPPEKKSASDRVSKLTRGSQSSRTRGEDNNSSVVVWGSQRKGLQALAERGAQSARHTDTQARKNARGKKDSSANIWGAGARPRASAANIWGGPSQMTGSKSGLKMFKKTIVPKFASKNSLDAKMSEQHSRLASGVGAGVKIDRFSDQDDLGVGPIGPAVHYPLHSTNR